MIENWYKFNEKLYPSDIYDIIEKNLYTIRSVFAEFEDMNTVEYGISTIKSKESNSDRNIQINTNGELNIGFTFRSNEGDDIKDRFLNSVVRLISEGDTTYFKVNIRIPSENDYGNQIINSDGIKLFDDILTAVNRLRDMGYDIKLDLN